MERKLFIVLALVVVLLIVGSAVGDLPLPISRQERTLITIKTANISAEVADSEVERSLGLSGREGLSAGQGLLFVFPEDVRANFWMKDMKFPIDIIWVNSEKRIIHIEHSLAPSTYPKTFSPEANARYVLEVPAGFSKTHDFRVGDLLTF